MMVIWKRVASWGMREVTDFEFLEHSKVYDME